jgi:hypothetical protein
MPPERHVRATYSDESIVVYQAYGAPIGDAALAAGTFVALFKRERDDVDQAVLPVDDVPLGLGQEAGPGANSRDRADAGGFERAFAHAPHSHHARRAHDRVEDWKAQKRASPVRVQWDPDRSLTLDPLRYHAIQIGLSGEAVTRHAEEWTRDITEVTGLADEIHRLVSERKLGSARANFLPNASIH